MLFEAVFGSPMGEALWRWKYGDGRGSASAVWEQDGRMIAHYGGFPRQTSMFGKAVQAMQMGDVMVHPDARGTLSRKGPLFLSASHFAERTVGFGKPVLLSYGFPNLRHMRVAVHLGLYGDCGKLIALTWQAAHMALPWWLAVVPVDTQGDGWRMQVDRLWAEMAADFKDSVICVRNARWIAHRFLAKPDAQYQLHWVRNRITRRPLALVVTKRTGEQIEWLDMIGPTRHWTLCKRVVLGLAAGEGLGEAFMWISAAFAGRLSEGARETDLGIPLPNIICTDGPKPETIRDRWYLTGGDTDFL
jgi:hypothetical protein